jgi:uncharacterized iron-regulated membrane protein
MKLFRTVIFWLHLCCGVFAGAVVLLMSITGVLLTYELQLQKWETGGSVAVPASTEAVRLPLEALLLAPHTERPDMPSNITISSDPFQAVTVSWGREGSVMLNPYTGEILPPNSTGVRDSLSSLRSWHRWLGQESDSRSLGRSVTGVCNMAFLFIVVSGIYLWCPRAWTARNLKAIVLFRGGLSGKARDFNWHNVIGVWSMIPLFFIVFSGAVLSYSWVSGLVYQAFGEDPPVSRGGGGPTTAAEKATLPPAVEGLALAAYFDQVKQAEPDWRTVRINLPKPSDELISLAIDRGSGRQPHLQSTMTFDRTTAEVTHIQNFSDQTPGYQARRILRFMHTGELAGVMGQTLAGIVSAGAAVLVWTGIALAWRRFRSWLVRTTNA